MKALKCYGICLVKLLTGQDWESIICRFPKDAPKRYFTFDDWISWCMVDHPYWVKLQTFEIVSLGFLDFWLESGYVFHAQCVSVWIPHPPSPRRYGFGIGTLSWGDTTLQRLLPVVLILILVCQKCCADALTWLSKAKMHMVYSGSPLGEPITFLLFFRFFFRRKLHFRWHLPNKLVE